MAVAFDDSGGMQLIGAHSAICVQLGQNMVSVKAITHGSHNFCTDQTIQWAPNAL